MIQMRKKYIILHKHRSGKRAGSVGPAGGKMISGLYQTCLRGSSAGHPSLSELMSDRSVQLWHLSKSASPPTCLKTSLGCLPSL